MRLINLYILESYIFLTSVYICLNWVILLKIALPKKQAKGLYKGWMWESGPPIDFFYAYIFNNVW